MAIDIPHMFTPRPYQLDLFKAMDTKDEKGEYIQKRGIIVRHRRAGKDKA